MGAAAPITVTEMNLTPCFHVVIRFVLLPAAASLFSGALLASGICIAPDTLTLGCVYSNFGSPVSGQYQADASFQSGGGLIVAYTQVAIPFLAPGSFFLEDIEVAVSRKTSSAFFLQLGIIARTLEDLTLTSPKAA